MADDINKDAERRLEHEAEIRRKIAESSAEYLRLLKDIKAMHKSIATVDKEIEKKARLINELESKNTDEAREQLALEKAKYAILNKQKEELTESAKAMTRIAKETRGLDKSFAFLGEAAKDVGVVISGIKKSYGLLKNWAGLFEIDKSIRMASLSMGLLDKRSEGFRDTLKAAGDNTIKFGVGIKELAALQASFSEELGRSVLLSQNGLEALGQMAAASNLGAEGAAKMTAEMEQQGYSAERTRDFVEQTMNDASKMGLNASKVVKNIQQNIKMLNKYNFKGGVKGLAKMAETTSKLGIDMNSVAGMADKLFDIEGAVDMSAQLQVLGGSWAQLADPFHLMYMARNDMAGLTEEIGNAAASSAHFNAENKDFEISAMEMHRLRKVAEQTGMSYDELATAAKNAAKFSNVKRQMRFDFKDKATQEFIQNTAEFNEKGEAVIQLTSGPKLVKQLTQSDRETIKTMMDEKKTLEQRAKDAQSFDEKLTNLTNQFKQMLIPLVELLDKTFRPVVDKLSDMMSDSGFRQKIDELAKSASSILMAVGKFIADNPIKTFLGVIAGMGLFEAAKWYINGKILGAGFNSVASAGGGGGGASDMLDNLTGGRKGKSQFAGGSFSKGKKMLARGGGRGMGGFLSGNAGKMLGGAAGGALAGGINSIGAFSEGNTGEGIGNIAGGVLGGALGTFLDPFLGPFGTMLGAQLGSMAGGYIGGLFDDKGEGMDEQERMRQVQIHDGIVFNQKDKFLKMNDGAMIAGTNVNGNKDLAKAITNQSPAASPSSMKIEFGEVKFAGEIKLSLPGNQTMHLDLRSDPVFMRELTKIVHTETAKAIQGGKVKP